MNEQMPPPEQGQPATPPPPAAPHHNPVANIISRMSIMQLSLALILLIFLWQWFDTHQQIGNMQQDLARRLAEMEGNNKASQLLVKQEQDAMRELSARVALQEARYAEAQNQRAALETLYQELSGSRDQTALAEVEQMLLIAGQQLQLSANVKAALIAMQQADDRLKRMDRAALGGLRTAIGSDMDKLRALPAVDVHIINSRLDELISAVDALPLVQDLRTAHEPQPGKTLTTEEPGWKRILQEIWEDAKNLIRIENTQKRELPLLPPTQTFFLRENLKLRLLSARLALLARDDASFKHDLQATQEWVTRYFDTKSPQGALALKNLQKLHASSINIELPDLSASLEAVRNYRISREKAAR